MAITQQQWDAIEQRTRSLHAEVELSLNGRSLLLRKEFISENRTGIRVWIDQQWCPSWGWQEGSDFDPIVTHCWRKHSRALWTQAQKQQAYKQLGKRQAQRVFPNLNGTIDYWLGYFPTAKALRQTLQKNKAMRLVKLN